MNERVFVIGLGAELGKYSYKVYLK